MSDFESPDPEQAPHKHSFVLSGKHCFIQNPSEIETGQFRLGIEHRIAAGAFDVESYVTFEVEDIPELLDRIAEFNDLPRYTDLLEMRSRFEEMAGVLQWQGVGGAVYSAEIRKILKGK